MRSTFECKFLRGQNCYKITEYWELIPCWMCDFYFSLYLANCYIVVLNPFRSLAVNDNHWNWRIAFNANWWRWCNILFPRVFRMYIGLSRERNPSSICISVGGSHRQYIVIGGFRIIFFSKNKLFTTTFYIDKSIPKPHRNHSV